MIQVGKFITYSFISIARKEVKTMARKPMITRTIISTTVTVLCMDLVNRTPVEKTLVLPRTYKDDKALMKVLSKEYDTEELKVASILDKKENQDIYGMTEAQFIQLATKLDENRKFVETETEEQ